MEILPLGTLFPQYSASVLVNLLSFLVAVILRMTLQMNITSESSNTINLNTTYPETFDFSNYPWGREKEYFVKLFYIGGIISAPFFGCLVNLIGRKKVLTTIALFLLLYNIFYDLVEEGFQLHAIVLTGTAGFAAVCIVVPIYIGEIAEDDIRGVIGTMFNLFLCFGMLFTSIISFLVECFYFFIGHPIYWLYKLLPPMLCTLFLVSCTWLPESPIYSLLNNRTEEAKKALIKLRKNKNMELIQNEFENLKTSVQKSESYSFMNTILNPATKKALIIGIVLVIVRQLCSINIMYDREIFIPHDRNFIIDLLQVLGAIIATGLIDRVGRKVLLLVSSLGMIVGIVCQFLWMVYKHDSELFWLTAIAHTIYIVSFDVGFGSVPWVLFSEIFKEKVRGPAISFCVLILYVLDFYVSFQFDGFYLAILAVNCVAGAIFVYFYIPETKGRSLEFILAQLGDEENF